MAYPSIVMTPIALFGIQTAACLLATDPTHASHFYTWLPELSHGAARYLDMVRELGGGGWRCWGQMRLFDRGDANDRRIARSMAWG